jgi:hypothetical protein
LATRTLAGLAQTTFLVRNLTVPNSTTGWFTLTSSPTPIVPMAEIYWALATKNQTEVYTVPIEQLDADGFRSAMRLRNRVRPRGSSGIAHSQQS